MRQEISLIARELAKQGLYNELRDFTKVASSLKTASYKIPEKSIEKVFQRCADLAKKAEPLVNETIKMINKYGHGDPRLEGLSSRLTEYIDDLKEGRFKEGLIEQIDNYMTGVQEVIDLSDDNSEVARIKLLEFIDPKEANRYEKQVEDENRGNERRTFKGSGRLDDNLHGSNGYLVGEVIKLANGYIAYSGDLPRGDIRNLINEYFAIFGKNRIPFNTIQNVLGDSTKRKSVHRDHANFVEKVNEYYRVINPNALKAFGSWLNKVGGGTEEQESSVEGLEVNVEMDDVVDEQQVGSSPIQSSDSDSGFSGPLLQQPQLQPKSRYERMRNELINAIHQASMGNRSLSQYARNRFVPRSFSMSRFSKKVKKRTYELSKLSDLLTKGYKEQWKRIATLIPLLIPGARSKGIHASAFKRKFNSTVLKQIEYCKNTLSKLERNLIHITKNDLDTKGGIEKALKVILGS